MKYLRGAIKFRSFNYPIISILLTLTLVVVAQQSKPGGQATPDIEQLKKHVKYLASDKLEGRYPGSAGADRAAAYLAEQFNRYKLGCADENLKCRHNGKEYSGYLKEFPFVAAVELARNNSLKFNLSDMGEGFQVRSDWMPLGFSSNGSLTSTQLIFTGFGITAADLQHDDYSKIDANGKIALAFASTPDGDNNPHGKFGRYLDPRWKAVAAKDHGARALILIARGEKFADDSLTKLRYDQTAGEAGLPVIVISRQVAARLLGLSDPAQLGQFEETKARWTEAAEKLAGSLSLSVDITRKTVPTYNVMGIIEGSDPKLKREYIVIGAHYDHLGRGDRSSLDPNSKEVHHGADDNASGTAGLLELARIFSAGRKELRRSILFIGFSAEESGLIGSHYYVNHPFIPLTDTLAMLNLDMIGRMRDNKLTLGGVGTSQILRKLVEEVNNASESGSPLNLQLNEDGFGLSDHSSFYAKKIPVLFFFTGTHDDYHKPSDTADKINYEGQAKVVSLVSEIVRAFDQNDVRPTYALARSPSTGRSMGFRVYLGTVPNYADSNDGMLLDAVRDDSPAAKAGIKGGDKIVKLAGRDIKNVYDYTYALGEMKPDQEVEVEVVRGSNRLQLKLTPQVRK
ncbi:MAG: M28 family peptidase [Acidobacteria bacterium]|nr:M28 family peptidase [Acidobacteriota bacterium]